MIRGWANYHRTGTAKETFSKLDHWMYRREVRYVKHTHPTKPKEWTQPRYWGRLNLDRNDHWVFGDKHTGAYLLKFSWFPIERHTLVKGRASPDDPALKEYWKERQAAKAKDLTPRKQKLAQRQQGYVRTVGNPSSMKRNSTCIIGNRENRVGRIPTAISN